MTDRREFLSVAGRIAGSIALASGSGFARAMHAAEKLTAAGPDAAARDEAFWTTYRNAFTPDPGHKWFNCLAFNPAPASTHESFLNKERGWSLESRSRKLSLHSMAFSPWWLVLLQSAGANLW
jgi:hypothetical protein